MRILFAGGGTAGHITPALAICEIIRKKYSECECAFVGRLDGDENRAILKEGYKLYTVNVSGIRRSLSLKNVKTILKHIVTIREAKKIIKEFKPDLIIGTGGYVSLPVLIAGFHLKIPTLLHESNAYPGLVTRRLGKKCTAVLLGIEEAKERLKYKKNIIIVGNPVRAKFKAQDKIEARKKLDIKRNEIFIVSFGGSGGADKINDAVIALMKEYSSENNEIKHIHATGRRSYKKLKETYPELAKGKNGAKIIPYIENMPELLSAADISITRSGAMTLAELECVSCVPILIPSPNVTANHQYFNAKSMIDKNRGVLLEEKDLSKDNLLCAVKEIKTSIIENKKSSEHKTGKKQRNIEEQVITAIEKALK